MSVILVILKWLAIVLGIVLGLILLLAALILFVPIRYYLEGDNRNTFVYSYRLTWLFPLLMIRKRADSQEVWCYVFFIPVKRFNQVDSVQKNDEESREDGKEQEEEKAEEKSRVVSIESQSMEEEQSPKQEEQKENTKKKRKRGKQKKSFSFDTVSSIIDFVKDKRNRSAMAVVWKEICQLLKYISPKKVKGDFVIGTGDPSTTGLLFGGISLCPFVYTDGVQMVPDFEEAVLKAQGYVKGRIRIVYLVRLMVRVYQDRELRRLWRNIKRLNKKEAA